ncbi:MAG TPA: EamA family transporter, partial [Candidatus Dormibacteraeota bacterium]|nr:EamA family transporter [Candidatus Dormibacteraeota bacterium]
ALTPFALRRLTTPAALAAVWLLFGSAFIAVRVGVTHVPPLLFAGSRLLAAGAVLLAWSAWRSGWRLGVSRRDVRAAGIVGLGLMAGGQGSVGWAAQYVAPGVLAVLVTLAPIWIALISLLVLRRPLPGPAVAGMVVAFGGVVVLASPAGGTGTAPLPALIIVLGSLSWAAASVYGGLTAISRRPVLATGIQLVVGGSVQLVASALLGELGRLHSAAVTGPAGLAWLYLLVGPSLVGFPLFTWLLANTPPAVANSQAYVSPLVALALGWLLLGTPIGAATLAAAAVILAGVALMVTMSGRRPGPAPQLHEEPRAAA